MVRKVKKESKVEIFLKDEWVNIPKGTKSVGIMQKKRVFNYDLEGEVVTQSLEDGYVLVEVHSEHLLVDYSPKDIKRGRLKKYKHR